MLFMLTQLVRHDVQITDFTNSALAVSNKKLSSQIFLMQKNHQRASVS